MKNLNYLNALSAGVLRICMCFLIVVAFSSVGTVSGKSDKNGKITICHIPPGNPSNRHTITISVAALKAHLAHGDLIGSCEGTSLP